MLLKLLWMRGRDGDISVKIVFSEQSTDLKQVVGVHSKEGLCEIKWEQAGDRGTG